MAPDVYDWYKRPKDNPEMNSGIELVETEGYLPADVQIMDMISAGIRLGEYRREAYDFGDGENVPDDFVDVRAAKDIVEVDYIRRSLENKLRVQAEKIEAQRVAMEKANAEKLPEVNV